MPTDFDPSRLHDPSSYTEAHGRQLRNYAYQVSVNYTSQISGANTQYITVSSNEVLTEDRILEIAESYARGSGRSGIAGEIDTIQITGAQRSK